MGHCRATILDAMTEEEHLNKMRSVCPRCGRPVILHTRAEREGCAVGWWPKGQTWFPARDCVPDHEGEV